MHVYFVHFRCNWEQKHGNEKNLTCAKSQYLSFKVSNHQD